MPPHAPIIEFPGRGCLISILQLRGTVLRVAPTAPHAVCTRIPAAFGLAKPSTHTLLTNCDARMQSGEHSFHGLGPRDRREVLCCARADTQRSGGHAGAPGRDWCLGPVGRNTGRVAHAQNARTERGKATQIAVRSAVRECSAQSPKGTSTRIGGGQTRGGGGNGHEHQRQREQREHHHVQCRLHLNKPLPA